VVHLISELVTSITENAYRFAHLDTKPFIKTTLEITSIPVDEITTALERLKPDQVYPFE
jgi:hypothetical protein